MWISPLANLGGSHPGWGPPAFPLLRPSRAARLLLSPPLFPHPRIALCFRRTWYLYRLYQLSSLIACLCAELSHPPSPGRRLPPPIPASLRLFPTPCPAEAIHPVPASS